MAKIAKKYAEAIKKVDREKRYDMEEALDLLPQMTYAKFDETVEIALRLGVDPRHSDQMVRGSVALPNGLGKKVRVLFLPRGRKKKRLKKLVQISLELRSLSRKYKKAGWTLIRQLRHLI